MSSRQRMVNPKILKTLLPIVVLVAVVLLVAMGWLAYTAAHPPQRAYLITPEQFAQFSDRGLKATEEQWTNRDGTSARGWLLRGATEAPAVVLLHRFGKDRSWLLNLAVKLNESTNLTVLCTDSRGHGPNPPIELSTFGTAEAEDLGAAINFLRSLKSAQGDALAAKQIGLYGVEMGGYASLIAATNDPDVRALALDSVPAAADQVLQNAVDANTGLSNVLVHLLARGGIRAYLLGGYSNASSCEMAAKLNVRAVLLMSGAEAGGLRDSTTRLVQCFPNPANVEAINDLPLTGLNAGSATGAQAEGYDRRIIDFFDRTLRTTQ